MFVNGLNDEERAANKSAEQMGTPLILFKTRLRVRPPEAARENDKKTFLQVLVKGDDTEDDQIKNVLI